jgi:hypothetical protein
MGWRAAGAAIATAMLLACGCGKVGRHRAAEDVTPVPTVMVGQHLEERLPTQEPAATQAHKDASFALRLSDDNDNHPSGVPVKVSGPVTRTITSDASGYVRGTVPPGIYRFNVLEGCHAEVIVQKGGSGQAGVVEGKTTGGTLLLFWQHRFGPAPPVFNDVAGDWPHGKTVDFTYAIQDHCKQKPVPGRSIPTFAFETSSNIKLVKPPTLRAGADGRSHVSVACTAPGEIQLDIVDTKNPSDRLDLMQLVIGYDRVPECAN